MTTLRPATEEELPGIFAIYDQEVLHGIATCDTEPRAAPECMVLLRPHDAPAYPLLVAVGERPGDVPGWGCLTPWSPRKAYARTCEDTVHVREDCQGRGLGRLILTSSSPGPAPRIVPS